ncbi:hypothetical protein BU251_09350 [Candidatus Velamenicoccus archaeovorus]|uniref:Methyltransferase domain-containing protein n=2 Tax=Velamenicoccus archaeovorus TaxID=1930593 RepID=A0A410P6V3_VELA1|nr:hypothetical protein BU251_09350 [Candidatus Velamenicoccus archaeovorus]
MANMDGQQLFPRKVVVMMDPFSGRTIDPRRARFQYSAAFKAFIKNKGRLRSFVAAAGTGHRSFKVYEITRFFISRSIDGDGAILDIGCANGFLLRCLQEWSGRSLVPYGVDKDASLVRKAKLLFPRHAANFVAADLSIEPDLARIWPQTRFDYIYWNVWDNYSFETQKETELLEACLRRLKAGGRLILGFYESDTNKSAKVRYLLGHGFRQSLRNSCHRRQGEVIVWKDVK